MWAGGWDLRRFQWKVVTLMLLVSAIPLLFSVVVVDQLLKDTVSLGFDDRVEQSLGSSVDTHRRYIKVLRRSVVLETRILAHDTTLKALLEAEPVSGESIEAHLSRWSEQVEDDHKGVAALELRQTEGPGQESFTPLLIDSHAAYPEEKWRAKALSALISTQGARRFELKVTWVVPWALFREFEDLGHIGRTFTQLERRQNTLTSGYTKTFIAFSFAMLAVTFLAGFLWSRSTTGRLGRLARATAQVGRGDLDVQVEVEGKDEIAQLTAAFNRMVGELRTAGTRLAYLERVSTWQEIARRLAHEIKNPLTPILLAVQQLDRKFDDYHERPERYRRLVSDAMEIVGEEVESLRKLVREFSDFARLPKVAPEPTDAAEFIQDLVRTNPQFAPHVEVVEAEGSVMVGLDGTMMRRALINLIENAQQAIDNAGYEAPGTITLRVREEQDAALIIIEDRGPGIAPEHLERLFDPYFTTKSEGTGLGLAIVRKIILDHGGDIQASSPLTDEGGARFTISLPRELDEDGDQGAT